MGILPIIAGIIVNQFWGALWYGPIIGKPYMKAMYGDAEAPDPDTRGYLAAVVGSIVAVPIYGTILEILGANTALLGICWGTAIGVMVAAFHVPHPWFEERPFPQGSTVHLAHQGYHFTSFILMGALFGIFNR